MPTVEDTFKIADYASTKGRAQAGVLCARDPAVWGGGIGIFGATCWGAFQ